MTQPFALLSDSDCEQFVQGHLAYVDISICLEPLKVPASKSRPVLLTVASVIPAAAAVRALLGDEALAAWPATSLVSLLLPERGKMTGVVVVAGPR